MMFFCILIVVAINVAIFLKKSSWLVFGPNNLALDSSLEKIPILHMIKFNFQLFSKFEYNIQEHRCTVPFDEEGVKVKRLQLLISPVFTLCSVIICYTLIYFYVREIAGG